MARPRSEDKRQKILSVATQLFAEEGLNAPTARIAKIAGVAEGSVFTYFASKDELLNQLYLELKSQLSKSAVIPQDVTGLQDRIRHAWNGYIAWGLEHPEAHKALAKLGVSSRITETTHAQVQLAFCDIVHLLGQAKSQGSLSHQSPDFIGSLMGAMADTTMDYIKGHPAEAERTCRDGFTAFWKAIAT